ncbi:MAG: aromatic ring-hydroxylating dioxygenase subunit alpha [Pseudomonadota bacterium]
MSTELTHSLDARYYTDPDIFQQELDGLLSTTWQFAGHTADIPNVGDYFSFEIAGQNLFAIRGKDNEIRAFYNVCQHRGHELISGSGNTRVVVCPYHKWTYELAGKLRNGPNIKSVDGLNTNHIGLREVRSENFCGFVFINLDDDAASMDEWYPGIRDEIREFVPHIDDLAPLEWVSCQEQCNWKISVENYNECYHCQSNHPTFSEGVIDPTTYDVQPAEQGYVLRHTTQCQSLEKMTYPIDLDSNEHAGDYQSWFLWPMFSFQCYPGNVLNTYHWRTSNVDNCTVWRGWYTQGGVESEVIRGLAAQDRATTVAEDILLVESVHRGLKSKGYQPGPLVLDPKGGVLSEHSIAKLQQWAREAVDA